jgi:hypothetical protein
MCAFKPSSPPTGGGADGVSTMARCVLLPSLPVSAFSDIKEVTIRVRQTTLEDVLNMVKGCNVIINYIRHPPTNRILDTLKVSYITGTEYKLYPDDIIIAIGLKFRAPVSGQDVNVTPDDLLVLVADVQYIVI